MSQEKMLSRRHFMRLSALVAGGVVVAACQPKVVEKVVKETVIVEGTPQVVEKVITKVITAKPAAAEKIKLTYWDNSSPEDVDGKVKAAICDRFREKNPNIELEVSFKPTTAGTQMSETLLTAIAGGNPPHAAYFDRYLVPTWAAEDALTDLTDLADLAGIKEEDYFPYAWEEATGWRNKLWALPMDADCRALYYNKELAAEAGFDPEKPPIYTEELDAWAEAMFKMDGPRMLTAGLIPWLGQSKLQSWMWAWDARAYDKETGEVTVNEPPMVKCLEWMASYAEKYPIEAFDSFASAFGGADQGPFYIGQIAMGVDGDWNLANIAKYAPELNFGVTPNPYPKDGGRVSTWAGGWCLVVPRGAPSIEEGFKFISYFAGPEEMDFFCEETAHIPCLKAPAEDNPYYSQDPMHKIFMDLMPIANSRPPVPIGQFLYAGLYEAQDLAIHGVKTPQEALDDLTARANEERKRWL